MEGCANIVRPPLFCVWEIINLFVGANERFCHAPQAHHLQSNIICPFALRANVGKHHCGAHHLRRRRNIIYAKRNNHTHRHKKNFPKLPFRVGTGAWGKFLRGMGLGRGNFFQEVPPSQGLLPSQGLPTLRDARPSDGREGRDRCRRGGRGRPRGGRTSPTRSCLFRPTRAG